MQSSAKSFLIRMIVGIPFILVGILLRPFWRSEWGIPTFLAIFWIIMIFAFAWGGRGKPLSPRFGAIMSSGLTLALVTVWLVHLYAGAVLLLLLTYLAIKTGFLERRALELRDAHSAPDARSQNSPNS